MHARVRCSTIDQGLATSLMGIPSWIWEISKLPELFFVLVCENIFLANFILVSYLPEKRKKPRE